MGMRFGQRSRQPMGAKNGFELGMEQLLVDAGAEAFAIQCLNR